MQLGIGNLNDSIKKGEVTPKFNTWDEFIRHTTEKERLLWCKSKASISNRKRLLAGTPVQKIMASGVWKVLEAAKGKCFYCGSLALEHLPRVNGKAISWAYIGRCRRLLTQTPPDLSYQTGKKE